MQFPRIAPEFGTGKKILLNSFLVVQAVVYKHKAPIEKHDPIHEISDNVILLSNGDSSDCNFGKFGLNQPMANPCAIEIKFAAERKKKR